MIVDNRECTKCKQEFPIDNFYRCGKYRHARCKSCFSKETLANYYKTKPIRLAKMKDWIVKNKEKHRILLREYTRNRYKSDPMFRLTRILRARLGVALRGNYKAGSAVKDLGCSIEQFKLHLESQFKDGMTWDNYGKWQVDHKKALATFNLNDPEEFKLAVHYSNMQPLWAKENQSKGKN